MLRYLLCLPLVALLPVLLVFPVVALAQSPAPIPDLPLEEVVRLLMASLSGGQYILTLAVAMVGLVFVLRKVGGKVLPWFDSPKGAVLLSVLGGTATTLAVALGSGTPFSVGLLLSCLMAAASASGLFSWGQTVFSKPKPTPSAPGGSGPPGAMAEPPPTCTPRDIANGNC